MTINTIILSLALLLASDYQPVKQISIERLDSDTVRVGSVHSLKTTVRFNHEACDEAAKKTSFYVKGADIVERSKWLRLDDYTLYHTIKVKIKDTDKALITAVLIKHTHKSLDQLELKPVR